VIDTLKIESGPLNKEAVLAVAGASERRCLFGVGGDLVWELTTGFLDGSYDHRMSVRLRSDSKGYEHLVLEGSVHKHLLGHNIFGGPLCLSACATYLVAVVSSALGVDLGDASSWRARRVDIAFSFDLGSEEAVHERIRYENSALNNTTARQKVTCRPTGWDTTRGHGAGTRLKAYHKGPEFHKHDQRRLKGASGLDYAELLTIASRILRYEVEFYDSAIQSLCGDRSIGQLNSAVLHTSAIFKINQYLRENMADMEKVRVSGSVEARLREVYGLRLGALLYGMWLRLATNGERSVRESMPVRSFYRQKSQLISAGCSWIDTDVYKFEVVSAVPKDFSISMDSPYLLRGESPQVVAALLPYSQAS
jgi:II/X family phage/plasmid replication protein